MRLLATLAALLGTLTSCGGLQAIAPGPGAMAIVAPPPPDPYLVMIEDRKDDLLRRLATCESGGYGSSEKRIYGGNGLFHGRFQFMLRTLQAMLESAQSLELCAGAHSREQHARATQVEVAVDGVEPHDRHQSADPVD